MATQMVNPKIQFDDDDGNPCSGCKVFFYETGTSTKQATYTDAGGGTPNSNPVVLDSYGQANIWLNEGDQYRVILAPSTDSDPPVDPIWTEDNINSIMTLTIATDSIFLVQHSAAGLHSYRLLSEFDDLADAVAEIGATDTELWGDQSDSSSTTVPSNISFKPMIGNIMSGTVTWNCPVVGKPEFQWLSGTGHTIKEMYLDWIGGVGDGSTDNATAFTNAIASLSGGGTLHIGAGTYNKTSTHSITNNSINIIGAGRGSTTIAQTDTNTAFKIDGVDVSTRYGLSRFEGFLLDGSGASGSAYGFHLEYSDRVVFTNVDVESFPSHNFYLDYAISTDFYGVHSRLSSGYGLYNINSSNRTSWFGGNIDGNEDAVYIEQSRGVVLSGIDIEGQAGDGILIDNSSTSINIIGCYFEKNDISIKIGVAANSYCYNINIQGNTFTTSQNASNHIEVEKALGSNISFNTFTTSASGVDILLDSAGSQTWMSFNKKTDDAGPADITDNGSQNIIFDPSSNGLSLTTGTGLYFPTSGNGIIADNFRGLDGANLVITSEHTTGAATGTDIQLRTIDTDTSTWTVPLTIKGGSVPYTQFSGFIEGAEITDPGVSPANTGRFFFQDNGSGKTQFAVRFPSGAIKVVVTED